MYKNNGSHTSKAHCILFITFQVTQLKIVSNPFAKGFRDDGTNDV